MDETPQGGAHGGAQGGMRPAAFFDLDRTVMSGASTFYFAKAAVSRGFYPRRRLVKAIWKAFWFKRMGSSDEQSEALKDQMLEAVRDRTRAGMDALLPDVLGPIMLNVFPEVFQRILVHERAGVPTYLCSAAPVEVVEPVARALGMSGGALATTAAVDEEGRYTGELVGPWVYGQGKVIAMEEAAERDGLDLKESYAYSDSFSDLPMLEAVGHPVVVNPDRALRDLALDRGWEIIRFESRHPVRIALTAGALTGAAAAIGAVLLARDQGRRAGAAASSGRSRRGR
jgi:HAD superfamily hydrolase (TIGR01490 family)